MKPSYQVNCPDYGFEHCNFVCKGTIKTITKAFAKHMKEIHDIEFQPESWRELGVQQ